MTFRNCTFILLLGVLLAARLLDVHFHVPPKVSGEAPHLVALTLIKAHHHADEPDHGHIAQHLFEGEQDEDEGTGLLAKVGSSPVFFLPVLFGLLLLGWRRATAQPASAYKNDSPPRPRHRAHLAPPSQAPPLSL